MVFESVLTQVLNRFLGAYVENLDTNQLNVGIWGGDVKLSNLVLKQSALDDLDLPLQTIYGKIGKLVLKIPWKNLYGSAFVINVEDVYLLASPNQQVKYDAVKESIKEYEAKKRDIFKVELAKKQEAEKDKPKADNTFVEKLITQIIKNVQLNIKNIHIRYEDKVTSPTPFALGITLSDLDVVSTDETWKPMIIKDEVTKIFKIVRLDGLAVYWNCDTSFYENLTGNDIVDRMTKDIASKNYIPNNYTYVLGPINASARLRINQKPELDQPAFSIPKIHLNLDLEKLFVGITKAQYRDILALTESMGRMAIGTPFRKYRPDLQTYRGHYKEWWKFAYTCVLEGEVRRNRRNWDWNHIQSHRELLREYGTLYQKKLTNTATNQDLKRIEECEKAIDTFNIVIIRQRIEMQTERDSKLSRSSSTWFGWMWGKKSSDTDAAGTSGTAIMKQFENAMTKEEKARLYKAIDYQENALPAQFPEEYVDNSCTFLLRTLEVELRDDSADVKRVVFTELKGVRCRVDTRAAANAIKVHVKIDEFTTYGLQQEDFIPRMIISEIGGGDSGLLEISFETNPLDKLCGQRLYITSRPLQIVYDAQTIIKVVDVFKAPPSSSALDQISAAADSGLANIKEMSSTGLQYAIDTHVHLDLKVDLQAPYIIIPYNGKYTENENVIVINLGNFQMHSLDRPERRDVRKMHAEGIDEKEILKQLMAQSYDRFELELNSLSIMIAQSNEDWKSYIKESRIGDVHLLHPINLKVDLAKCMITDDPKLPLTTVTGNLPSIVIDVSDARLLLLMALVGSIPLPKNDIPEPTPLKKTERASSSTVMLKYWEMQDNAQKTKKLLPKKAKTKKDQFIQFTTVQSNFIMTEFALNLKHQDHIESAISNIATFKATSLEFELLQQTFNTKVFLRLATLLLVHYHTDREINIISSPGFERGEQYLFEIKLIQVDKASPEFHSVYKSCESSLILEFAKLVIVLHKESLLSLIKFATTMQTDLMEAAGSKSALVDKMQTTGKESDPIFKTQLSTISEGFHAEHKAKKAKTPIMVETIKFKLSGSFQELTAEFTSDEGPISSWALLGTHADVIIKSSYTQINAKLNQIAIVDLNPETVHNLILSVEGNEALSARVVLYNLDQSVESDKSDLSIDLTMGGLRIVFLNWFVMRMLHFFNDFQAAQAAIVEASQAAAKTAKENFESVYTKATKLSLNVDVKAPDILVPADSKSYDAVFLDLGHISVSNKFITLDIKNEQNFSAVIDEMRTILTDFKVSRVKLNQKSEIINELTLLVPVTFKMIVKRNLSNSWYKALPDIDITGVISSISLLISQRDYQMIMSVISGNLAEGQKKIKSLPPPSARESTLPSASSAFDRPQEKRKSSSSQETEVKANTFLRFSFTMDKLVVSLYTGGSKALSENSSHSQGDGLARFCLEGISIKARILTDDSIMASFILLNCYLDDMRRGREDKLNRLIQRAVDFPLSDSVSSRSMIDATIQIQNNNTFLDLRVFSFTMILSVDYLLKLVDFVEIPEGATVPVEPPSKQGSLMTTTTVSKSVVIAEKEEESHLTLNLKIERPDIILVEHMDNIDTKALILNSEILIKFRTAGSHQVVNGSIKDLQLYTCSYNPAKRAETKSNVLHPVTISLAGSTPENKGLHVELLVTDIRISVSPATIELLSHVSATATGRGVVQSASEDLSTDYSNIWNERRFEEQDYWFLKADEAVEVTEALSRVLSSSRSLTHQISQELCIVSMPSIIFTLEAGVGQKTLPMLILESSFKGNIRNWSSQLSVDAGLTLQMSYFNSRLAVWEPLIEPVEVKKNNKNVLVPWELKLDVVKNEQDDVTSPTSDVESGVDLVAQQQALMCIDVSSDHSMEIVVTKTCLEVLNNLGKAFADAMKAGEMKAVEITSPYRVVNELGCSVTVDLGKGSFRLFQNIETVDVVLENGAEADLQQDKPVTSSKSISAGMQLTKDSVTHNDMLHIRVDDKNCELDLPVVRADKRYFPLNYRGEGKDNWGLISDIKIDEGVTVITLRSILQVYNHFNIPIEVYYMTVRGNELASITTVEPDSVVNIPLNAVYTPTNELFFSVAGYSVTTSPYIWKDLQTNLTVTKTLHCSPKDPEVSSEAFIIQAIGEMEQVYFENTVRHTMSSTCYNIHLRPAVVFKNCLPINIAFCIENTIGELKIDPGKTLFLPNVEPGKSCVVVRLPDYLDKEWASRQEISENPNEFSVWVFNSHDSSIKMSLNLGMHVVNKNGSVVMTLYCPFWMLNKTGLMLGYRKSKKVEKNDSVGSPSKKSKKLHKTDSVGSPPMKSSDESGNVLHHPANFKGPILFSFNVKNFFGKKKAAVRVEQGEWSDKFSIDVAGSSGTVVCKYNDMIYQIGVHNQLTYNNLTKQITFTPYFVIINDAPFAIECQENDRPGDPWIEVEPKSCSALWPKSELDDKLLKLRVKDTADVSSAFLYTESHTSLLKLKNKHGGVNVDIQISEGATYISLAPYYSGTAPALIINNTKHTMNFWEKESVQIKKLASQHCMLYTWENPSGPRILVWEGGQKKEFQDDLRKDGGGDYPVGDNYHIYWVSFLDGMQRVLLFTQDKVVARNAQAANLMEVAQQEITVSIYGVGLSLVNNYTRQEIMYMAIASSGIIWQHCKVNAKRFKNFNSKESAMMEAAYQRYQLVKDADDNETTIFAVDNKTEVDFQEETMMMLKPHKRKVKRTFQTGLWLQMKSSPNQFQLHAKINRLQMDNQMHDCIFPVVLAPVPPPKSVAVDIGIKPFAELSIVQLLMRNSQIKQFKYFKMLIQEFHLKVDLGFVNSMVELFQGTQVLENEEQQLFLKDVALVHEPLYAHVSTQSLQEQKSFYDLLHFSPLKIHISFSMAAGSSTVQDAPNFINVLLQGLGVTLTDLQDVIFKLAYFEREYTFLTQRQLIDEATSHYVGQTIKQLYVLVLGLDVLGNPYGLVRGITQGVEDLFYEPFQGAIQGPGEFAEGLALGVRSLFGHTVGGAAGAVSRITGAMGKGIAALTFDKDYQRKRRDQFRKQPKSVQESLARGSKGVVMGVVDGVTGVITKPISGAREEGIGGFFKGLGKGAIGLLARPTAGVLDLAGNSLDAVKRVAEVSEETNRLRSPRFLQGDGLVRPFNTHEAEGNKLLMDLEKGKYATTDIYVSHFIVIEKKEVLLLTDKRVTFITHNEVFGGWQVDWAYTWSELKSPPSVVPKGVAIPTGDSKKKKLFGNSDSGKIVLISDPEKREEVCAKIESLRGDA